MADFHSYFPHLMRLCAEIKPVQILEWGPGDSTQLFLTYSEAKIYSIESNPSYMESLRGRFGTNPRVQLELRQTGLPFGASQQYVTYPILNRLRFDLIMVDGRNRCDCLAVAALCLNSNGAVLLHDSERINYHPAFSLYGNVEQFGDTAVLRDPRVRIEEREK